MNLTDNDLASLNADLDASGAEYSSEIYAGTEYGFTMRNTDSFDEAGAQRHWDQLLNLLRTTDGS